MSLDLEDILPVWTLGVEAFVKGDMFVLECKQCIALHIGELCNNAIQSAITV